MTTSETIATGDGTITLRDSATGELYHNSAGAYLEAMENYVRPALAGACPGSSLRLLDICFGLGYNTFAFIDHLARNEPSVEEVEVLAVEADRRLLPVIARAAGQTCFKSFPADLSEYFLQAEQTEKTTLSFELKREEKEPPLHVVLTIAFADLRRVVPGLGDDFDLVFHDPFSPSKVPELWTVDLFSCYQRLLTRRSGRVLTYSIASAVRGGFLEAGFVIYRTAAVGRKAGGTLALHPGAKDLDAGSFFELDSEELAKLASVSGIPYRDPDFDRDRKTILKLRQAEQDGKRGTTV
ncbi:MAG: MnmC family methyltransferase [Candidatus Obscuribacterales bacterium]